MAANKKIIVIDPERGSMVEATVDNELYNILTASRKQVGNVHITTEQKVANVFRTEVRNYMHTVEVGGKAGTFYGAFKIDYATTPVLSDTVNALANRALEFDEIGFWNLREILPEIRKNNNSGKALSNVDANNEFRCWAGARRLEEDMELRVGYVRFCKFIWRLFWDEEFQESLKQF